MPTTINLPSKFAEDKNGNKFAPITTPNAVRFSDGDTLNDKLIQSDWNQSSSSAIDYIKNKPSSLPANGGNAATVNSHTVNSDVPANAVFTDTTYSVMGASGGGHASGLVPDPGSTAGTTKFLREDGTWVVPTADVSGKEDKMSIVNLSSSTTTLTASVNTLYRQINVNTLAVILPNIANASTVSTIIFRLDMGSTPNLTFTASGMTIEFASDYAIGADKGYEISCINYSIYWGIVAHEVDYDRGA